MSFVREPNKTKLDNAVGCVHLCVFYVCCIICAKNVTILSKEFTGVLAYECTFILNGESDRLM